MVDGTEATEVLEDPGALYGADIPALAPTPARTINVGTRLRVRLTAPVVTSFAGSPVTASVAEDVLLGDDVALPAGTLLVGEAFGTFLDDRAQIAFSAMIRDGRTVQLRAIAVGSDSRLGVPGRVVRKASVQKKGMGRLLGSVGSALAVGLAGQAPGGVLGDAGINLAEDVASGMTQLDRTWATQRSDKAIEVPAGAQLLVYLQADVKVQ